MSGDRYTKDDWEYFTRSVGDEGDDGYCPDAYVEVYCLIPGCGWSGEGDWQPDELEGVYRWHWRKKHAKEKLVTPPPFPVDDVEED